MTPLDVINSKRVNYERRLKVSFSFAKYAIYIHSSAVQPTMSGLLLAYDDSRLAMASGQAPSNQTELIIEPVDSISRDDPDIP